MLLFPHNSSILDSVILCLESFYRSSRARSFGVGLVSIGNIVFIGEQKTPHFQCMAKCILSVTIIKITHCYIWV